MEISIEGIEKIGIYYDFHIHSCLSPCGEDEATPAMIAGMAKVIGLDAIALTDHNSAKNCPAFMKACEEYGIIGIPGMELTTEEEVHVVCIFETLESALAFGDYVEGRIIKVKNREDIFGRQIIRDEEDREIGQVDYLLINATTIPLDEVYDIVTGYGGIMIPAHIDKGSNSLLSNLGFVPEGSRFSCVELAEPAKLHQLQKNVPYINDCKIIFDSDAHYLADINEPKYQIYVKERNIKGIFEALR